AQALVVLDRPEDARAEQAVAPRLERAVVDRLRLLDLAERPRPDALRARDRDLDLVEGLRGCGLSEDLCDFLVHHRLHWSGTNRAPLVCVFNPSRRRPFSSFPRKRESSGPWTPACAGVTKRGQ